MWKVFLVLFFLKDTFIIFLIFNNIKECTINNKTTISIKDHNYNVYMICHVKTCFMGFF